MHRNLNPRLLLSTLAAVTVLAPMASRALSHPGGGGPGGTIYFINGATPPYSTNYMWSMTSDGGGATNLGFWGHLTVPSRALHNGHRYYLTTRQIVGSYYGDGTTLKSEVFLHRDD